MQHPVLRFVASTAFVFLTAASCSQSPSAPSSIGDFFGTQGLQSGTVIRGTIAARSAGSQSTGFNQEPSSGIQVCVVGTTNCDFADKDGNFELKGNFSGDVNLEFTGGPNGPVSLVVPNVVAGETVTVAVELTSGLLEIESRLDDDDSEDDASEDAISEDVSEDEVSEDAVSEDDVSEDEPSEDEVSEDEVSEDDVSEDDDSVSEDNPSEDDDSEDDDSEDSVSEDDDSESGHSNRGKGHNLAPSV